MDFCNNLQHAVNKVIRVQKYVIKSSGEQEPFSVEKFQKSLRRTGASQEEINQLTDYIEHAPDLKTTRDIYKYALNHLRKKRPAVAVRYNLKNALSQLGPSGFPFEHFIAEIFKNQGYEILIDQIVQGFCVTHEIDIILKKNNEQVMVECKFHQPRLYADVKVPLYIKSRFDDLEKKQSQDKNGPYHFSQAWIVTNTKFTSEALQYGICVGLKLLSWSYPEEGNLAQLIDELGFHPITALTSLSNKQKRYLIEHGFVLCKDAAKFAYLLKQLGLSDKKVNEIIKEAQGACELGVIR